MTEDRTLIPIDLDLDETVLEKLHTALSHTMIDGETVGLVDEGGKILLSVATTRPGEVLEALADIGIEASAIDLDFAEPAPEEFGFPAPVGKFVRALGRSGIAFSGFAGPLKLPMGQAVQKQASCRSQTVLGTAIARDLSNGFSNATAEGALEEAFEEAQELIEKQNDAACNCASPCTCVYSVAFGTPFAVRSGSVRVADHWHCRWSVHRACRMPGDLALPAPASGITGSFVIAGVTSTVPCPTHTRQGTERLSRTESDFLGLSFSGPECRNSSAKSWYASARTRSKTRARQPSQSCPCPPARRHVAAMNSNSWWNRRS